MASTLLSRTPGVAGNRRKWTFSTWVKIGVVGGSRVLFASPSDGTNYNELWFSGSAFRFDQWTSGSSAGSLVTNRLFRDPAAWYNIVCVWDSDNATPGDRMKLYVNGVEETSFSLDTNPAQYLDSYVNSTSYPLEVGGMNAGEYFDGIMAHTHFADGQAYAPTVFGETDSTSGIWIAKTSPSVTYGTNGFFLKYASGALGTDSSGNGNNLVASGTMTPTKDNAMNSFCTMNPLDNYFNAATFSNGNNYIVTGAPYSYNTATTGLAAGLWYFEVKVVASTTIAVVLGVSTKNSTSTTDYLGSNSDSYSYYGENGKSITGGTQSTYGDTYTDDDIIGVYLDLTANKLYFAKNGTIQNSGTGLSITAAASTTGGFYLPSAGDYDSVNNVTLAFNFGNGYFGTTAISGAVADAGGEGQFKYNPSTGTFDSSSKDFRAICTNNLATYG